MSLPTPRAILFDWDNTLVDSWGTIHEALNFLMRAMEKPEWTLAETREKVRLSLREAFPLHFGERWEKARDIYLERFRAIHLERLTALPGREIMLRGLHEHGIYLGVVSNKTGGLLRREVAQLGWAELFGSVVGAGDAPIDKPASDPVHLALKPSGVAAGGDVWFVGDTAVDMECALASGCVPVRLGDDAGPDEFRHFPPQLSFTDHETLFHAAKGLRFGDSSPSS
ncbi:MAG: HAD hydrolase-like protein [Alphaproteobacteria bacterium]|nr:HAD hydrolase-like protein [Alphaproteobacteria bacterium]